jgi:hypothetical protein
VTNNYTVFWLSWENRMLHIYTDFIVMGDQKNGGNFPPFFLVREMVLLSRWR